MHDNPSDPFRHKYQDLRYISVHDAIRYIVSMTQREYDLTKLWNLAREDTLYFVDVEIK